MISVNLLRSGTVFTWEDLPWKVQKFEHIFKGRGRGKVTVSARNLKNGSVREIAFQSSDAVEEADVARKKLIYLYRSRDEAVFERDGEEVFIPLLQVEWEIQLLTKHQEVWAWFFDNQPIGLELPPTVELGVKTTDPGIRGDTVSNTLKPATLETGLVTRVPLFINEGDRIIVDTQRGEYRKRA